jgi:hypothetical protein
MKNFNEYENKTKTTTFLFFILKFCCDISFFIFALLNVIFLRKYNESLIRKIGMEIIK